MQGISVPHQAPTAKIIKQLSDMLCQPYIHTQCVWDLTDDMKRGAKSGENINTRIESMHSVT